MTTIQLNVKGMSCGGCASRVKKALSALPGVSRAEVTLETGKVIVDFDADKLQESTLRSTIFDLGFEVPAS